MAVVTTTLSTTRPKQLRPFDARCDLEPVADLIESCFSATLDPDGRRYLRNMRAAAQMKGVNRWTAFASGTNILPIAGFVWEESGQVVGNLSLVPFFSQGRRIDLIANVAVSPEYRRRGIARAMTAAALDHSRKRYSRATWLQARHDNQAATNLYTKMGFITQARRTTWVADPIAMMGESPPGVHVTFRRFRHWSQQRAWLNQNYPLNLQWHFPLKMGSMRPGVWGFSYRFINEIDIRHWAVEMGSELIGVLSWQGSRSYADHLWLAALPEHEALVLKTVIPFIHQEQILSRPVTLDFPEGRAVDALSSSGFKSKTTLVWMEVNHGGLVS